MKKYILISLAMIAMVGCNPPNPKQSTKNAFKAPADLPKVEEAVITFDDEGEASLDRNFYFLFDGSGSMGEVCSGERKIDGAKTAIMKFLEKVPEDANIGLLVFGTDQNKYGIEEVVPLGKDNRELFKEAINKVEPLSGTPLANATNWGVRELLKQYKKQLGYGEYRLIIVTDGNASDAERFMTSLNQTRQYPFIAIYGIGLCMASEHMLKSFSIKYTDANNYEELGSALEETISELPDFDPTEFSEDDFK